MLQVCEYAGSLVCWWALSYVYARSEPGPVTCQVNDSLVHSMTPMSSPTLKTGGCGSWFGASFRTCRGGWGQRPWWALRVPRVLLATVK